MSDLAVLTTVTVVAATEAKALIADKRFTVRPVVGGFILGIFLFSLEAWNEDLTGKLCALIILASLLINGSSIATALNAK